MRIADVLAAPGLALFFGLPPGPRAPQKLDRLAATLNVSGWVLDGEADSAGSVHLAACDEPTVQLMPADGACEVEYDVRRTSDGRLAATIPSGHGSRLVQHLELAEERRLLRIVAPESAVPGLNWALGFDALRVLEAQRGPEVVDWLVSVDADDEEDMRERIECGVQGEAFRRDRVASALAIHTIRCGPRAALALPEACRAAAATPGALPADGEVLWRVAPFVRSQGAVERCLAHESRRDRRWSRDGPFWVSARSAADASLLARALPAGSTWVAHLSQPSLPTPRVVATLAEAGCGGVALAWSAELDEALGREQRGASALREWEAQLQAEAVPG